MSTKTRDNNTGFMTLKDDRRIFKLAMAIDRAMLSYHDNESIIYNDQKEINRFVYDPSFAALASFRKSGKCSYPDCANASVRNSHTIQKATTLKLIAENGHVYSPTHRQQWQNAGIALIGVNDASTFPGFCEGHEQLFSSYEEQKDLTNDSHFRLQIYRTICREVFKKENELLIIRQRVKQYVKFRDRKLAEYIQAEIIKEFEGEEIPEMRNSKHQWKDGLVLYFQEKVVAIRQYLRKLRAFEHTILNDLEAGKDDKMYFTAIELDWQIPCCLAGRGGINMAHNGKVRNRDFIINILPYENKTYLLLSSFKRYKKQIDDYLNRYIDNPFMLITMCESWMLYGSDHWFIRPSVWDELSTDVKQKITDELHHGRFNISAVPELIIFINARLDLNSHLRTTELTGEQTLALLDEEKNWQISFKDRFKPCNKASTNDYISIIIRQGSNEQY